MTPRLTSHAVARYIERVKPGLNPERAKAECEALAAMGFLTAKCPPWMAFAGDCEAYLLCGDVAFPVKSGCAVTCLVRGLVPDSERRRRNRARAARTFARTHKRPDHGRPVVEAA